MHRDLDKTSKISSRLCCDCNKVQFFAIPLCMYPFSVQHSKFVCSELLFLYWLIAPSSAKSGLRCQFVVILKRKKLIIVVVLFVATKCYIHFGRPSARIWFLYLSVVQ